MQIIPSSPPPNITTIAKRLTHEYLFRSTVESDGSRCESRSTARLHGHKYFRCKRQNKNRTHARAHGHKGRNKETGEASERGYEPRASVRSFDDTHLSRRGANHGSLTNAGYKKRPFLRRFLPSLSPFCVAPVRRRNYGRGSREESNRTVARLLIGGARKPCILLLSACYTLYRGPR